MKILIIKLGADGDVLRTLPLAEALKSSYVNSHITWVTRGDISELLNVTYIDRVLSLPYMDSTVYDRLYNFDIDESATELAMQISAKKKYGFYKDGDYPAAFNKGAEYYLNTVFDDSLKKSNTRTYQEMMFELAELPYIKKRYRLILGATEKSYADAYLSENNLKDKGIIGIHMGASSRWPSKVWDKECLFKFIEHAVKNKAIILFGGPNEAQRYMGVIEELKRKNITVHQNNPHNTKREFMALLNVCEAVVCSDSFALHVSLGLGKKTIALFFCTSPNEVEGYGLLTKKISPMLYSFFPEKSDVYDLALTQSISPESVLSSL
jgi:heptosyltransferase-2